MPNPIKYLFQYLERTGVRRDLHWFKRMWVEAPHLPVGLGLTFASITAVYIKLNYFFDSGIGYQTRYLVLRPDDPRIPRFQKHVINPEGCADN